MITKVRRPSMTAALLVLAAALGLLAYTIYTTRPVGASTGTTVNIADPTTATNLAHINRDGALSVSAVPATPNVPLNLEAGGFNYNGSGGVPFELLAPTHAHIDLTSLTLTLERAGNTDPWTFDLAIVTVPNGTTPGSCFSSRLALTVIEDVDLQPGTTVSISLGSPIVFQPPSGQTRCLEVYAFNDGGSAANNWGRGFASATGFVVSGTYSQPHNTNTAVRPPATKA